MSPHPADPGAKKLRCVHAQCCRRQKHTFSDLRVPEGSLLPTQFDRLSQLIRLNRLGSLQTAKKWVACKLGRSTKCARRLHHPCPDFVAGRRRTTPTHDAKAGACHRMREQLTCRCVFQRCQKSGRRGDGRVIIRCACIGLNSQPRRQKTG